MGVPSPSRRRHRLSTGSDCKWRDPSNSDRAPWRAIVCSHLGRNLLSRQVRLSAVHHFAEQALAQRQSLLAVPRTAVYSWVERSAEILGADTVSPEFEGDRDAFAIQAADQVDAVYIRRGGKLEAILKTRLQEPHRSEEEQVRVLLTGDEDDEVARALMTLGAIGIYRPAIAPVQPLVVSNGQSDTESTLTLADMQEPNRWLIHSTRARSGAWPGESESQFMDSLLLSPPRHYQPSPLETLQRIIDQQRLIGTHRTSSAPSPVVCFSSLPLAQWLQRRAYRPHLSRWDAEPYGIAIDRGFADSLGIAPVFYGNQQTLDAMPSDDRWLYQAAGETFDWTSEQEWRAKGVVDLRRLPVDAVRVFVRSLQDGMRLRGVPWKIVVV